MTAEVFIEWRQLNDGCSGWIISWYLLLNIIG